MAPPDDTTPATRFNSFNVYRTSYKKIGSHSIDVGILVPKTLEPGKKHPLLVKFHGGGLVTSDCLYADWFSAFFIPLIHRASAIAILPNYRLLPDTSGTDIAADLASFWTWFHTGGVATYLASQAVTLDLDYSRLLVSGDSAGGYLALMSGLTLPKGRISAILAQYPMTWYLRREPLQTFLGGEPPGVEVVDEYLATVVPGTVVSSSTPPARQRLSYAMSVHGRYLEFFGDDKQLWPLFLVDEKEYLPPTWIVHGDRDMVVSVDDSRAFVEKCGRLGGEVVLEVREGEDHGFDVEVKEGEEGWLKKGLGWVEEKWLV